MKNKKSCKNCKYYPMGNHWPCVDCHMLFYDRWEKQKNHTSKIKKETVEMETNIEDAYKRGAEDAWNAALKIVLQECWGGYSVDELKEIFKTPSFRDIIETVDCLEAIEKIREHEKRNKFKVGDEVTNGTDTGVVTKIGKTDVALIVLLPDGVVDIYNPMDWTKTGRHFQQIVDVLGMMNKEE